MKKIMICLLLVFLSCCQVDGFTKARADVPGDFKQSYQQYKNDDDLIIIKKRMQELGYFSPGATFSNVYSDTIIERVKLFQKMNGLPQTGVIDSDFLNTLYSDSAVPTEQFGLKILPTEEITSNSASITEEPNAALTSESLPSPTVTATATVTFIVTSVPTMTSEVIPSPTVPALATETFVVTSAPMNTRDNESTEIMSLNSVVILFFAVLIFLIIVIGVIVRKDKSNEVIDVWKKTEEESEEIPEIPDPEKPDPEDQQKEDEQETEKEPEEIPEIPEAPKIPEAEKPDPEDQQQEPEQKPESRKKIPSQEDFESQCIRLLKSMSKYGVCVRPTTNPTEKDILFYLEDSLSVAHCIVTETDVNVQAIQNIIKAQDHFGAENAYILTNAGFSLSCVALATRSNVVLWDGNEIAERLGNMKEKEHPEFVQYVWEPMRNVVRDTASDLFASVKMDINNELTERELESLISYDEKGFISLDKVNRNYLLQESLGNHSDRIYRITLIYQSEGKTYTRYAQAKGPVEAMRVLNDFHERGYKIQKIE